MSHTIRRFLIPIAALCLATLVAGCVVVPERHRAYGPCRLSCQARLFGVGTVKRSVMHA